MCISCSEQLNNILNDINTDTKISALVTTLKIFQHSELYIDWKIRINICNAFFIINLHLV